MSPPARPGLPRDELGPYLIPCFASLGSIIVSAIRLLPPLMPPELLGPASAPCSRYLWDSSCDLGVFASEGKLRVSSFSPGDVIYVPMGCGRPLLRNPSDGPADVWIVFSNGDHESIESSDWLVTNLASVVADNLQIPVLLADQFARVNREFAHQR